MSTISQKAQEFRDMHSRSAGPEETAFIIPNPWDLGSARMLAGFGFRALATSSAGFAFTLGRRDGQVTRAEALAHAGAVANATDLPVSADLENGFGHDPSAVVETIEGAGACGIVGCSIEDASGEQGNPIYSMDHAVERIRAAVSAAQHLPFPFTLTARAENFLHGRPDLDDTILRLQAFEEAGAEVLYAPGLPDLDAVRAVCRSVSRPVNVLVAGKLVRHTVTELSDAGAARLSLGSVLARHVLGHLHRAAAEMVESGTFGFTSVLGGFEQIDRFMLKE